MPTRTSTEVTRISAVAAGSQVRVRSDGGAFRVMRLAATADSARVALVPDRALLLAGDRVRIEVEVEARVTLDVVETTGTVAYNMRGAQAAWEVVVKVATGGRCRWEGLPFVVAAGADVVRTLEAVIAPGAALALRETLVLGRHGEAAGRVCNRTRVTQGGVPVLVEDLDTAALLPHRIVDSVVEIGDNPCEAVVTPPHGVRLDLAEGGNCWRSLSRDAHRAAAALDPVWNTLIGTARP